MKKLSDLAGLLNPRQLKALKTKAVKEIETRKELRKKEKERVEEASRYKEELKEKEKKELEEIYKKIEEL